MVWREPLAVGCTGSAQIANQERVVLVQSVRRGGIEVACGARFRRTLTDTCFHVAAFPAKAR